MGRPHQVLGNTGRERVPNDEWPTGWPDFDSSCPKKTPCGLFFIPSIKPPWMAWACILGSVNHVARLNFFCCMTPMQMKMRWCCNMCMQPSHCCLWQLTLNWAKAFHNHQEMHGPVCCNHSCISGCMRKLPDLLLISSLFTTSSVRASHSWSIWKHRLERKIISMPWCFVATRSAQPIMFHAEDDKWSTGLSRLWLQLAQKMHLALCSSQTSNLLEWLGHALLLHAIVLHE